MVRRISRSASLPLLVSLASILLASELKDGAVAGLPDGHRTWQQEMDRARQFRASLENSKAEEGFLHALKLIDSPNADGMNVAATLLELGAIYQDWRQDRQAEDCYRRGLDITTRRLGASHPANGVFLANLLALYVESGLIAKAERLRSRCTAFTETLGPNLPHTGRLLESLGLLAFVQGRYSEAERCFRRALAQLEHADPAQPAVAIHLRSNLAIAIVNANRSGEAMAVMEQAVDLARKAYGRDCPLPVDMEIAGSLSIVYMSNHRDSEAEVALKRAVELGVKSLGPEHPTVGRFLLQYSLLLQRMGRKAEAKQMARRGKAILEAQASQSAARYTVDVKDLLRPE